jgi:ribosome-binding factor A
VTTFHKKRFEEEIKKEVSRIVIQELSDPRIGIITISRVSLSKDLHSAKIFITVLDSEKSESSLLVLNKAKKRIRWFLSKRIQVRRVPELTFFAEESVLL